MYHAQDGLYFEREDDGDVKICLCNDGFEFETVLDKDTWASVVASVCAKGENDDTFRSAELFHKGNFLILTRRKN